MHNIDEYAKIKDILIAVKSIANTIVEWCGKLSE